MSARPLRLGRVAYINTFPIEWALGEHLDPALAVEVTGVPTRLNELLRAGEIDVANVSSIEYATRPESYVLLPSLCVGSEGAVDSVNLVGELPPERVRTIAGDPEIGDLDRARAACSARRPRSSPRTRRPTRAC